MAKKKGPAGNGAEACSSTRSQQVSDSKPATNAQASCDLTGIAARINAAHERAYASARTAIEHAVECGLLLREALKTIDHSGWLPWIEQNLDFGPRQAQKYLRVADHADELRTANSKSHLLSIDSALKALVGPRAPVDEIEPPSDPDQNDPPIELSNESERNSDPIEKLRTAELRIAEL